MTTDFKAQVGKLAAAVGHRADAQGASNLEKLFAAALPILYWIGYLKGSETTGVYDEMLDGVRSTIVETSGCLALGLVRPAIFSMRGQVDVLLSWLFFKDHPVEWNRVLATGDGYKLKTHVLDYLEENIPKFKARFALLRTEKLGSQADPYRLLSAHVHGQSTAVVPIHGQLESVVAPQRRCVEVLKLQTEISEYSNDVLLAYYASKWASLPEQIVDPTKVRLGEVKMAKLLS